MEKVYFRRTADAFGLLSNFAPTPIVISNKTWLTSEAAFQAMKYTGDADNAMYREEIRQASSPYVAAQLGRSRKHSIRNDWDIVKVPTMALLLKEKFLQNEDVQAQLVLTGNAEIIERSDRDSFWGDGPNRDGKNQLGKLWMAVRKLYYA